MADMATYEQIVDRDIDELIAADRIKPTDSIPFKQDGTAKRMTGQLLINFLTSAADGHGGIQSYEKVDASGLADIYRFTLADKTQIDITITNGRGISNTRKHSSSGLVDTYKITYNDGTFDTFTVTNGDKGDPGADAHVWVKFASVDPSQPPHSMGDIPDSWIGFCSTHLPSAPSDWNQYVWYKIKGEPGDKGDAAELLESSVTYQVSTSGHIEPSGSWTETIPSVPQGYYLWTRVSKRFNSGDPVISFSVSRMGIDGLGSVSTVCGNSPDPSGNVAITAENVGALPVSGGNMSGNIDMGANRLTNVADPVNPNDAARKDDVDQRVNKTGDTMTGNLSVPAPSEAAHAVNKGYVDTKAVQQTLTVPGWVGDSAPFTQTITVAGLTDGRRVRVYPAYGDDYDTNLAVRAACACLSYTKRDGQNVTFTCLEDKPTVDINIVAEVYI